MPSDRPSTLTTQTALEYFRERVETTAVRQRLAAMEATRYYVVNLLSSFVHLAHAPVEVAPQNDPLALRLLDAVGREGIAQRTELRRVGDVALFLSGFFSDHVRRSPVDLDYYLTLGSHAYGSLSRPDLALAAVFGELADNFGSFVDLLMEISEDIGFTSSPDLLQLYERWLQEGRMRDFDRLVGHGVIPARQRGIDPH